MNSGTIIFRIRVSIQVSIGECVCVRAYMFVCVCSQVIRLVAHKAECVLLELIDRVECSPQFFGFFTLYS